MKRFASMLGLGLICFGTAVLFTPRENRINLDPNSPDFNPRSDLELCHEVVEDILSRQDLTIAESARIIERCYRWAHSGTLEASKSQPVLTLIG